MSGSGGTSDTDWRATGVGETGGGKDPCDIRVETTLNSPDPVVLRGLSEGDALTVVLASQPPTRVVALTDSGQIAGSVTAPVLPRLIQCLQSGNSYVAHVLVVREGTCDVLIQRQNG